MSHLLDLGTRYFEGLLEFKEKLGINQEWKVYCYEVNPTVYQKSLQEHYSTVKTYFKSLNFYNVAVSNHNGFLTLNEHVGASLPGVSEFVDEYNSGSNILNINPQYDPGNGAQFKIVKTECKCVDIIDVINNIIMNDSSAEIYIKCDIEGAEFEVLPRLLTSDKLHHIKEMYVEWHERFWKTVNDNDFHVKCHEKYNIINNLRNSGIQMFEHG